jgi:hypothetical protein
LACCLADVGLTLAGQPAAYWRGEPGGAREANPLAWWLLAQSPGAFLAAVVAWMGTFTLLFLFWRSSLAPVLAFLVTLGHALGAASWLVGRGPAGLAAAALVMAAAERLFAWAWGRAISNRHASRHMEAAGISKP